MSATRCAMVLVGLTVLGAATAEAQGRAAVSAHARVEEVQPSRKSLQIALELAGSAEGQFGREGAPGGRRMTPYGAVTVRPAAGSDDPARKELITTIAFW